MIIDCNVTKLGTPDNTVIGFTINKVNDSNTQQLLEVGTKTITLDYESISVVLENRSIYDSLFNPLQQIMFKNLLVTMAETTNNSLMKKTKAQLIEIILRKDEVERECRTEISNLNKKIKDYMSYLVKLQCTNLPRSYFK